jgi:CheY-like chemotaxis protein/predicted regulator of Ras-like GTPase activity (Roadblock/LC7/MglB family)
MASDARRIVLVDDEEVLAWSLSTRLARARPSWTVDALHDGESALARIQSAPVDLLVADVRMPGLSGTDLIVSARRDHPRLPVIVMTAFRTPDVHRIINLPFTGFLEKPFEFERLLELVDEALRPVDVGFSGAISVQTLPDIVQLYILSSATGMLVVNQDANEGRLWFERGTIVHAMCPNLTGDEAFYEIMTWSRGEFGMRVGVRASERSVRTDWQGLLMESCRRIDERQRHDGGRKDRPRTGWTHAPPPPDEQDVDAVFEEFLGHAQPTTANQLTTTRPGEIGPEQAMEARMNIKDSLAKLNQMDGFVGAALVDAESGMLLGQEGGGNLNLEIAAAGNTEVVRAKRKTMGNLALKDAIEDILITLGKQYHLIRPLRSRSTLFFYVALDRQRANLAMARIALADVEKDLQV